jgi:hypothetical protein
MQLLPLMNILHQIPRPLLTLPNPPIQRPPIPRLEPHLEILGLHSQTRRQLIRLETIHDGLIARIRRRRKLKRADQPHKRREQLAVRQVAAHAHARPGAVPVMRRPRAIRHVEIPLRIEGLGGLEVGSVVVGGVGVHIERRPRGDHNAVPFYRLDGDAGEADGDDGPVAEDLLVEGGYVGDFFFVETALPGVAVWVRFHDF